MPKQDDTSHRDLLVAVRELLEGPPLSVKFRLFMEALLDMLGEQDLGKRMAMRDEISAYLDGDPGGPLVTRPHDWPHEK